MSTVVCVAGSLKEIFGDPFAEFFDRAKEPERPKGIGYNAFKNMFDEERARRQPKAPELIDMFDQVYQEGAARTDAANNARSCCIKVAPSDLESSTISNLAGMLKEFVTGWEVSYSHCLVPTDLRDFFLNGGTFTRATFSLKKADRALFIHVDFKETIEVYVIHQVSQSNVARRVYTVNRSDSLALFRIITTELENIVHGDFKGD